MGMFFRNLSKFLQFGLSLIKNKNSEKTESKVVNRIIRYVKQILIYNIWYKVFRILILKKNVSVSFKQNVVKSFAKFFSLEVLIETGTYFGDMIYATRKIFKKIYSIEIDEYLYKEAKSRFSKYKHISILHGDSMNLIPKILSKINQPCLFWLDAHYSGVGTGKGPMDTPVMSEVENIFNLSNFQHILLIDDARDFKSINDYPTIEEIKKFVKKKKPNWKLKVKNDIIRIYQNKTL